ncbi:hypothetical protein BD414DRAFT_520267 [Trametes punicea]|nr:hypothetical protein BD414DRAFT_520267 [Trametes punicea]
MSTKKLRSKIEQVRHFFPRKHTNTRSPNGAGLSEKMLRPIDNTANVNTEVPPPPPPKDYNEWNDVRYAIEAASIDNDPLSARRTDTANSRLIFLTRQMKPPPNYSDLAPPPDELGALPSSPAVPAKPWRARTASSRIPVAASRISTVERRAATVSTPEEAELRRREAQRRREQDERDALREEAERQARLKREKELLMLQYAEEEEARKAALAAELRRAAEERRRREAIEREAAALESMLVAERKRQERERRRLETEKLQRWRRELEERALAQDEERKKWRERTARERRARAAGLEAKKSKTAQGLTVLLTGWVTVQSEDCLSWKRRYFQLCDDVLVLLKDAEDDSQLIESIGMSSIQRIREWQEGFEELEAIPNSFALELQGSREPRNMFTDNAEDKENLLALLSNRLCTR